MCGFDFRARPTGPTYRHIERSLCMKAIHSTRLSLLLVSLLALTGCITHTLLPEQGAAVRQQGLSGLPYHPLVHHLDLSILAYELYGQTLVWPFDPYYVESGDWKGGRDRFLV